MKSLATALLLTTTTLAWLAAPSAAGAHALSRSFSSWHVAGGEVSATFTVAAREVTRLPAAADARRSLEAVLAEHLASALGASAGGSPCHPTKDPAPLAAEPGQLRLELRYRCPSKSTVTIDNDAFFDAVPSHLHFARVREAGRATSEAVLTNARRRLSVASFASAAWSPGSARGYLRLGIEHIVAGVDHVAFLVALLLLCRRFGEVLLMVTGFTVGHSITLTAAALGLVAPDVAVVEALIGFTIALVAVDNVAAAAGVAALVAPAAAAFMGVVLLARLVAGVGPPAMTAAGLMLFTFAYLRASSSRHAAMRLRPVVTLVFGMIHGLGFASALLAVGLPPGRLVASLLAFNVGVELGQLAVVALLWLGASLVARRLPAGGRRLGFDVASAALCGVGVFWFVARSY